MSTIQFSSPTQFDGSPGWEEAVPAASFNALANNGGVGGNEFDNSSNRYRYARFSFAMVTSTVTPSAGAALQILILPVLDDGSTYPDHENTTVAANLPSLVYARGVITFRSKAAQSIKGNCDTVLLPPSLFKVYVINRAMNGGSALPASSTNMTLMAQFYSDEVV